MEDQQAFSSQPKILNLSGVGELLKRAWKIYKARFWTFLGIMLLPLVINLFFGIVLFSILFLIPVIGNAKAFISFLVILCFIVILIAIIIGSWAQISLLYAIKERGTNIGIKKSFQNGWSKIVSFIWISILGNFIVLGAYLLVIVPGLIFAIWFSLSSFVLVSEDLRGTNVLLRSKQWVRGKWGSVFWRLFAIGVITILISFVIVLPITFFFGNNGSNIVSPFISLFLGPFLTTYTFLIYEDLRKLKGDIPFEPPKRGTKIIMILVPILGFLLLFAILALAISIQFLQGM